MYQNAALKQHSSQYKWRIMLSCTELCPREEERETLRAKPYSLILHIILLGEGL